MLATDSGYSMFKLIHLNLDLEDANLLKVNTYSIYWISGWRCFPEIKRQITWVILREDVRKIWETENTKEDKTEGNPLIFKQRKWDLVVGSIATNATSLFCTWPDKDRKGIELKSVPRNWEEKCDVVHPKRSWQ